MKQSSAMMIFFGLNTNRGSSTNQSEARENAGIRRAEGIDALENNSSDITLIFIHYHPQKLFPPCFVRLIDSASNVGYRIIVSSNIQPSCAAHFLNNIEHTCLHNGNFGYDFVEHRGVRAALANHGLISNKPYVIINSSMLNIASSGFGNDSIFDQLSSLNKVYAAGLTS